MKNCLLIVMTFVFSIGSSYSQIRTGGAGAPAKGTMQEAFHIIKIFEKHLIARDKACSTHKHLSKNSDLMQSYLKLSFIKSSKSENENCESPNQYFACFSDEATQQLMNDVNQNKFIPAILMTRYDISEQEAERMIKFFNDLNKRPE